MRSKECAKNIFQSKEVRKRLFTVANLIYKTKTGEKNFPPASPNQLNYLSDAAYNDAACTPSTPAMAPATAMITFKTTLQVFFIDFSSFLFLTFQIIRSDPELPRLLLLHFHHRHFHHHPVHPESQRRSTSSDIHPD